MFNLCFLLRLGVFFCPAQRPVERSGNNAFQNDLLPGNLVLHASAVKALKRHLWYLMEEIIPLSLFSEIVPAQERQALARRLLELKPDQNVITPCNQYGTGSGKSRFPENVSQNTTLADLAGKDSWFTMNILQIDNQFLTDDVDTWSQSQAYQSSLRNILAVNVVNNSVKHGVKLGS